MCDLSAPVIDLSLYNLDLVVDLDTLITSIMDSFLYRFKVTLKVTHDLALIPKTVLMLSLSLPDFILEAPNPPLELPHHVLEQLEISIPCLMMLNFLSICVDDPVPSVTNYCWLYISSLVSSRYVEPAHLSCDLVATHWPLLGSLWSSIRGHSALGVSTPQVELL